MTANTVNNFPLRPMKTPFAGTALISANTSSVGGINVSTLPATGDNVANVATGFPETFSTSITKGGKYIKRADVNAMGYIATIMAFRQQMGMPNEWNKQICDAIGGYPKGAVLDYCIWNGSVIQETYKITSLTDDNTEDPTTTAQANWKQWARVSVNAEYLNSVDKLKSFYMGPNQDGSRYDYDIKQFTWTKESSDEGSSWGYARLYYSNVFHTVKKNCFLICMADWDVSDSVDDNPWGLQAYIKNQWKYIGKGLNTAWSGTTLYAFLEKGTQLRIRSQYTTVGAGPGYHTMNIIECG